MHRIFTLTLSPVIDVHYRLDRLIPGTENFTAARVCQAAGKGVNITRALSRHGIPSQAYVLLGEDNASRYLDLLHADGLDAVNVTVPGHMREYISVNEAASGVETRICYKAFRTDETAAAALGSKLTAAVGRGDLVCISGGLPEGLGAGYVVRLAQTLNALGALVILDSAALDAAALSAAAPLLIKPNLAEACKLTGLEPDEAEVKNALADGTLIRQLTALAPNVLLSLGSSGAVFAAVSGETEAAAAVPVARVCSTVGAGDHLLAGFVSYLAENGGALNGIRPLPLDAASPALHRGLAYAAELVSELR